MNQKLDLKLKPKNTPKIKKGSRSPVSSFIAKTYEILEDAQFPDIIDWNLEGNAIIIKNPQEFAMKVLSVYFKHRNLTSFVRQLNMYNFRKQRTHKVEHVYCHELFQRDKKYLLEQIKRKNQEQFLPDSDTQEAGEEAEPSDVNQDIVTLIQEKQALKRFNTQASIKISCLEGKVKDLTVQNETLKDQLRQQSERDKILISLMASILKKYGIPPTELTSIMKDDPREVSFQQQPDDGLSFGPSKMDIDISTFLNFDNDSGITKAASTVLNSKANLEAIRDVSPTPLMKNDPYAHWDSVSPRKFFNRSQNMNENEVYRVMNGGMRVRIRGPDMNLGLGKRRFEEEHGFGHESFETVMKKVEFAPSVKKIGEVRPNNEMNMMDQMWMKSKEVEEEFRSDFLNFKYTL